MRNKSQFYKNQVGRVDDISPLLFPLFLSVFIANSVTSVHATTTKAASSATNAKTANTARIPYVAFPASGRHFADF